MSPPWIYAAAVLLLAHVTVGADDDVIITVPYDSTSVLIYNILFTKDMFSQFHDCLCRGKTCRAECDVKNAPNYKVLRVTQENPPNPPGNDQTRYYICSNSPSTNSMVCQRQQGMSGRTTTVFRVVDSQCESPCIVFIWSSSREPIQFNHGEFDVEYCNKQCNNCKAMTTPASRPTTTQHPLTTITQSPFKTSTENRSASDVEDNSDDGTMRLSVRAIIGVVLGGIFIIIISTVCIVVWWGEIIKGAKHRDRTSRPDNVTGTSSNITTNRRLRPEDIQRIDNPGNTPHVSTKPTNYLQPSTGDAGAIETVEENEYAVIPAYMEESDGNFRTPSFGYNEPWKNINFDPDEGYTLPVSPQTHTNNRNNRRTTDMGPNSTEAGQDNKISISVNGDDQTHAEVPFDQSEDALAVEPRPKTGNARSGVYSLAKFEANDTQNTRDNTHQSTSPGHGGEYRQYDPSSGSLDGTGQETDVRNNDENYGYAIIDPDYVSQYHRSSMV